MTSIFKDRLTQCENADVVIQPALIWSYFGLGGGIMLAMFLFFAIINNTPFSISLSFMFLMMLAMFYIGWFYRYKSFIKFEEKSLVVSSHKLTPYTFSKTDIVEISPFEKGCNMFIILSNGGKFEFHEFDNKLLLQEFKKWQKRTKCRH